MAKPRNGGLPNKHKAFTAEIQRRKHLSSGRHARDLADAMAGMTDGAGPDTTALAEEVRTLQDEVRALSGLVRAHLEPAPAESRADLDEADAAAAAQVERQREEVALLKMELRALANSIQETKREIAQLRTTDESSDRLDVVAGELDAIVGATEGATDGILDAAEKIETLAQNLRANESENYNTQCAEEITEHVLTIFEHCNFQDITGQRITKVVNTLKFIEERVERMIEIWGRDAFEGLAVAEEEHVDEERKLLNGPQLENEGISQDDIDKLFD